MGLLFHPVIPHPGTVTDTLAAMTRQNAVENHMQDCRLHVQLSPHIVMSVASAFGTNS
jgi:hypothetical protein